MVVERWDKTAKVHFDKRVFQELCSLRFVEDARNVVILGPVGVGKTLLAAPCARRMRCDFTCASTAPSLLFCKLQGTRNLAHSSLTLMSDVLPSVKL